MVSLSIHWNDDIQKIGQSAKVAKLWRGPVLYKEESLEKVIRFREEGGKYKRAQEEDRCGGTGEGESVKLKGDGFPGWTGNTISEERVTTGYGKGKDLLRREKKVKGESERGKVNSRNGCAERGGGERHNEPVMITGGNL